MWVNETNKKYTYTQQAYGHMYRHNKKSTKALQKHGIVLVMLTNLTIMHLMS